jgi:hypothetical protein
VEDNQQPAHQQEDRPVISERQRAALAEIRIVSSRLRGDLSTTDEAEVQKEGFSRLNDYWAVQMSEPMQTAKFAQLLYSHTLTAWVGPKDTVSLVKLDMDDALRFAFETRQPWIIRDGLDALGDLANLYLHPTAAARWLLSLPKRRHLVPPALRAFLVEANKQPADYRTGFAGHPSSMHLIEAEMCRRGASGEILSTLKAECEHLAQWQRHAHPNAPPAKAKSIGNGLRQVYNELKPKKA